MLEQQSHSFKHFALFKGMKQDEITRVLNRSKKQTYKTGNTFFRQGDFSDCMFIILFGRVQIDVKKSNKHQKQNLNVLNQGDHFGELTLLAGGTRTATATALMETSVLVISKTRFKRLIYEIPLFSINISNTISMWLQGELSGQPMRHEMGIVGIIRHTDHQHTFTQQIVRELVLQNKSIDVYSDYINKWQQSELHYLYATPKVNEADFPDKIKNIIHILGLVETTKKCDHLVLDIAVNTETNITELAKLLSQCEQVWWLNDTPSQTNPKHGINTPHELTENIITQLIKLRPSLQQSIQLTWLHPNTKHKPAIRCDKLGLKIPDMHCQYNSQTRLLNPRDTARFYHQLIGVHIGLALGGGGARSLAHIGVLAALEENNITIDRIAGTSGGSIVAAFYAAGFSLPVIMDLFTEEMSPPQWMQFIPYAAKWHLLAIFKFGLIEGRFRRYLKDYRFDQLFIPSHLVSTDLISGDEIIRSSGSLVDSIVESINHPLLSKPICRDGLSLVDGGVLNNVPSSVLSQHNADFIISVDVGSKIAKSFGQNTADTPTSEMKKVGFLGTINRVLEIRGNGLDKTHEKHSDFMIQPDTSQYPFDDFTKVKQLYDIGYQATMDVMPELKQRYAAFLEE